MRVLLPVLALLSVAACEPPPPQSYSGGVGFGDYGEYQRMRAAQASTPVQTVQGPIGNAAEPFPQTQTPGTGAPTAAELAQAGVSGAASLAQTQPAQPALPPSTAALPATTAAAATPPAAPVNHVGISDEQDFSAVSSRETIESDKERIAQNRAQYQQIQPGALPERTGDNAARIIEYAVKAPNRLGEAIYKRSSLALSNNERACARYANPEEAQEAFLNSGGPQRDPKNLDPDGDGFACRWDPTPFQAARG